MMSNDLRRAARLVIDRWEHGDLAEAVHELAQALADESDESPEDTRPYCA